MSDTFQIEIETENTASMLNVHSRFIYKGGNYEFIQYLKNLEIDYRILGSLNIVFFPEKSSRIYSYSYYDSRYGSYKDTQYTKGKYNGKIYGFLNSLTRYKAKLEKEKYRFPFLDQLKGIGYGMLVSCICKALDGGFITLSSNIVLEATGMMSGMDREASTVALVNYYEKIGFKQMFPEHYQDAVSKISVPMIARVKDIIDNCNIGTFSKELLDILQIEKCKEIVSMSTLS